MVINIHEQQSEPSWDSFVVAMRGQDSALIERALIDRFGLTEEEVALNADLMKATASGVAEGNISEDKVLRRLGREYGPLTPEQRLELRGKVIEEMRKMFDLCERGAGVPAPVPLAALVAFGSMMDTRIGITSTPDLDLLVIPEGDSESKSGASWCIGDAYRNFPIADNVTLTADIPAGFLTGKWLLEHTPDDNLRYKVGLDFANVAPGSVVVFRNDSWRDLMGAYVDFDARGIEVVVLGIE